VHGRLHGGKRLNGTEVPAYRDRGKGVEPEGSLFLVSTLSVLIVSGRGGEGSLNKQEKEEVIKQMADKLQRAKGAFVVSYQGLDVETMTALRKELRKHQVEFQVVKNRLLKLASQDTGTSAIKEHFVGPCALAITYEDVVTPAKVLIEQEKKSEHLKIKIGQIAGRVVELEGIKRLAELPSREILLAQALSAMHAVPTSLVRTLNGILTKLMFALKAIESKKQEQGQ
jgi:large subunit ribosomal protein L10